MRSTKITELPKEISELKRLNDLYIDSDKFTNPPPEIARKGVTAIFEYFEKLDKEEKRVVNESKLILVGQGDVGKTCLAIRLIEDRFEEQKSTEGIDILNWELPTPNKEDKINFNVWDFGGQAIYYATHQFFLTKRSVYLLVWNARKAMDFEHIYNWLHTIEAFGEDSPVILVMSKYHERNDDLNMEDLRKRFPQIVELVKVDSKDGFGIDVLKKNISNSAWELPQMNEEWPLSWFNIRERLESETRKWIGYDEYLKICSDQQIDETGAEILCNYLHDLGIILCFRDNLLLKNIVIRDPEWATDAVYKVLDTNAVQENEGILFHSQLNEIWNKEVYPQNVYPLLLELMKRFELAYELPDKKSYLVAELLPKIQPEFLWRNENNLRFYYKYDFLPAGIITRFIVRTHEDLEKKPNGIQVCWREGAVLKREGARAFVKQWTNDKSIEIRVDGEDKSKRELLSIIRYHFDNINKSIKKVKITKEIPCSCSLNCVKKWEYKDLLELEKESIDNAFCEKGKKPIFVSDLLDGYETLEDRQAEIKDEIRVERIHKVETIREKETIIEKQIKDEEKKKTFWSYAWKIILGIIALLGGIWTVIKIIESETFKNIFQ